MRPFYKAVKATAGLCWRTQDITGTRTIGCLPGKTAYRGWNQPRKMKCVAGYKVGREEPSKSFDLIHGATRFGVCSAGFPSWSSISSLYPMPPFCNSNVYSVPLYTESMYFFSDFKGDYN